MAKGDGKDLKEAFDKAFEKVDPGQKGKWHTAEIFVRGQNPINTYRVVLKPSPSDDPS
jgi:hypothetical protein